MSFTANPSAFDAWNGESGTRWVASADERDRVLAPAADSLLAVADAQPGSRVLDLGCGCGATTLSAARAVGPGGFATGLDISEPMLRVARERADAAGVSNAGFVHSDAQTHDFEPSPVDLVISRFGTMFFSDPLVAFTNIARGLGPGGRLCLATWQPLVANEWLVVPGAALLNHTEMPSAATDEAGMFAQSDPDVVTPILTAAGFTEVRLEATQVTFTLGSTLDEAVDHLADSGPGRVLLETIPVGPARDAALADVREALLPHQDQSGVHLSGGIWIITATRGS